MPPKNVLNPSSSKRGKDNKTSNGEEDVTHSGDWVWSLNIPVPLPPDRAVLQKFAEMRWRRVLWIERHQALEQGQQIRCCPMLPPSISPLLKGGHVTSSCGTEASNYSILAVVAFAVERVCERVFNYMTRLEQINNMVMYKSSKSLKVLHQHCHVIHGQGDGFAFSSIQHSPLAHEHVWLFVAFCQHTPSSLAFSSSSSAILTWNLRLSRSFSARIAHWAGAKHATEIMDGMVARCAALPITGMSRSVMQVSTSTNLSRSQQETVLVLCIRVLIAIRRCIKEKFLRAQGQRLAPRNWAVGDTCFHLVNPSSEWRQQQDSPYLSSHPSIQCSKTSCPDSS
eukprot:767214-Hanusia_phi.AAC.1